MAGLCTRHIYLVLVSVCVIIHKATPLIHSTLKGLRTSQGESCRILQESGHKGFMMYDFKACSGDEHDGTLFQFMLPGSPLDTYHDRYQGYASLDQTDTGLHMRQRSRAWIVADESNPTNRFVFINAGELSHDYLACNTLTGRRYCYG